MTSLCDNLQSIAVIDVIKLQGREEMTHWQIKQLKDNFVTVTATKHEQIHQAAQQRITANEIAIQYVSTKFEDRLDAAEQDLITTAIQGN